jgi:hypothetical protein
VIDARGAVRLGLALPLAVITGCGDDSSTPSNPTPTGTGVVRLVPPVGCNPVACQGFTINGIIITGPQVFTPFTLTFAITSVLPFVPPGSYLLSDASFVDTVGGTTGCPAIGFNVATGLTTTVTFDITNDVCRLTVQGPA